MLGDTMRALWLGGAVIGTVIALILGLFLFYVAGRAFGLGLTASLRALRNKHLVRRH